MKDSVGNTIKIGDTVAVVYHPEAYKFFTKVATIIEVRGSRKLLVTKLVDSDTTPGYFPDDSGEVYKRVVKVSSKFSKVNESEITDAVGHSIHIGDRIACQRLPEAGGNTLKGFDKGGNVTRMTAHFVFYRDQHGVEKRKKLKHVVVY